MTREADIYHQIEGPLDLMKMGGKGWISIPSRYPFVDVPVVIHALQDRGLLHQVALNLTPLEDEPGMWEVLVSIIDDDDPGPLPSDQVDLGVVE